MKINSSALIREDEYVDDWLIDDLHPMKRRKMDVNGLFSTRTSKTAKTRSKNVEDSNHRTEEKRRDNGKAPRCRIEDSDIESDRESDSVTMDTEVDSDIADIVDNVGSKTNGVDNDKTLTDDFSDIVLDIDSDSEIPSITRNSRTSAKLSKPKQTKITNFGTKTTSANVTSSELLTVNLTNSVQSHSTDLKSRGIESLTSVVTQQNSVQSLNTGASTGVIRVKVQIKDKLLLIPIIDRSVFHILDISPKYMEIFPSYASM